ncbi:MAG: hypothetical protein AAF493_22805, partial [Pseudomonadota bacterium]
ECGYQVRNIGDGKVSHPATRGYITFDTSNVRGEIVDAELQISHPKASVSSGTRKASVERKNRPLNVGIFEVNASPVALRRIAVEIPEAQHENPLLDFNQDGTVTNDDVDHVFNDLGTGRQYGTFTVTPNNNGDRQVIKLSGEAISTLANASGEVAMGLALLESTPAGLSTGYGEQDRVFRGSNCGGGVSSLTIQADDVGFFLKIVDGVGTPVISSHFESFRGEHQFHFTSKSSGSVAFNDSRNSYYAFNVANITTVSSAQMRVWGWGPTFMGTYSSPDPTERVDLHSVENFTAAQIINAPYNDDQNHTLDVPIFDDLGDGPILGARTFSPADTTTGLIPAPFADPSTDCSLANAPCGKWLTFPLNPDAFDEIVNNGGVWVVGASVGTDGPAQLLSNTTSDLSPTIGLYPDFLAPLPELIISPGEGAQGLAFSPLRNPIAEAERVKNRPTMREFMDRNEVKEMATRPQPPIKLVLRVKVPS